MDDSHYPNSISIFFYVDFDSRPVCTHVDVRLCASLNVSNRRFPLHSSASECLATSAPSKSFWCLGRSCTFGTLFLLDLKVFTWNWSCKDKSENVNLFVFPIDIIPPVPVNLEASLSNEEENPLWNYSKKLLLEHNSPGWQ